MITHTLHTEQWLARPLEDVFGFFANAANLEQITPDELRFRILSPQPIEMRVGALINYQLRLAGIPFRWRSEITAWDPPYAFEDTQIKGPYGSWVHRHVFEERDGGTLITDHVRYALPLSPLGDVAFPLVRWQLGRIFAHRQEVIAAQFGAPSPDSSPDPAP